MVSYCSIERRGGPWEQAQKVRVSIRVKPLNHSGTSAAISYCYADGRIRTCAGRAYLIAYKHVDAPNHDTAAIIEYILPNYI